MGTISSSFLLLRYRKRVFQKLPYWLKSKLSFSEQIQQLRTALGVTQAQLAKQAESSQQAIALLEAGKVDPRLSTLQKCAEAMQSELIIQFVPKEEIEKIKYKQALKKARLLVGISSGSTALEKQLPEQSFIEQKIQETAAKLLKSKKLWE